MPRGGRTPRFCPVCGQRLDAPDFQPKPNMRPLPRTNLAIPAKTSGRAIAALAFGILAFPLVFCSPILGITAIVLGTKARNEIDASNGQLNGRGMATAGMVLGIIATIFIPLVCITATAAGAPV